MPKDTKLTVGLFFYNLPHMIEKQCAHWRAMPPELAESVELLFIDDCSATPITWDNINLEGFSGVSRLIRVTEDIPWNWGVKNLVWTQGSGPWCFFNDCDYFFGADTLKRMLELIADGNRNNIYFFKHGGAINKPEEWKHWKKDWPAAQYMAHKDATRAVGGYNEDLAGRRGYDDNLILDGYNAIGVQKVRIPEVSVWMDWDGRTPGLNRNSTENRALYNELRKNPINTGSILRFPFIEVERG